MDGVVSLLLLLGACISQGAALPSPSHRAASVFHNRPPSSSHTRATLASDRRFSRREGPSIRVSGELANGRRTDAEFTNQERASGHGADESTNQNRASDSDRRVASSSSLSSRQVDMMLEILDELRDLEGEARGGGGAVLTTDVYQGKKTLVYKLAPGNAIFGGKVRKTSPDASSETAPNLQERFDTKSVIYTDVGIGPTASQMEPARPPTAGVGPPIKVPVPSRQFQRPPLPPRPPPHAPADAAGATTTWRLHYMKPPPPISAMHNPYLTTRRPSPRPSHTPQVPIRWRKRKPAAGLAPTISEALFYPLGKAVQIARTKARGAWVSFLLLHYLGFIPPVPGIPRHQDPDDVPFSIMNMIARLL
ncbi:uncharacterized protein LOC119574399 [Penaeus monodon]|uniref:uncharacterized protein LOC119574399 n=1 Tax=Penaeus monodon TaxID=6687 RepID=UPI0018A74C54|nr:uncharacterized protein LOC119574399 [Penaeus monodon]